MNWMFYALGGPAIWSINNYIDKIILEKHIKEVGAYTIIYSIINFFIGFIIFLFLGAKFLNFQHTLVIFVTGFMQIVLFLSYFKALSLNETSRVIPLFQLGPIFALILGFIFLGDFIKPVALVGFLFVLIGSFVLSTKNLNKNIFEVNKSFWYMVITTVMWASIGVLFRYVVLANSFWQTFAWQSMSFGFGVLLIFIPVYRRQFFNTIKIINKNSKKTYLYLVSNEMIYALGQLGPRYALTAVPAALVLVINGVQPIFILLYGTILTLFFPHILKEDISKSILFKKMVSILIIFFGIFLISR